MLPISGVQALGITQPPWPSLSSKEQILAVANQGREGRRRQMRNSQEIVAQPWGGSLASPQGMHTAIPELFCRYWSPFQMGEGNYMLPTDTWTPDLKEPEGRWSWRPPTSPRANQKSVHRLTTPSLNHPCKSPHYCSRWEQAVLRALTWVEDTQPAAPPSAGKAIALFSSTSPQTLPPKGRGGWIWPHSCSGPSLLRPQGPAVTRPSAWTPLPWDWEAPPPPLSSRFCSNANLSSRLSQKTL